MTVSMMKMMKRLAKVAGFVALTTSCATVLVHAQATGGWTLNINNAENATATAGAEVPYRFWIGNNANQATLPTEITFTVPAGAVFLGVDGLAGCKPAPVVPEEALSVPFDVTCDVQALEPKQTADPFIVKLRPMKEGYLELKAKMADPGPEQYGITTVSKGADLAVELALAEQDMQAGSVAHFSAKVTNIGPHSSDGAELTLPLPVGLSPNVTMPTGCLIAGKSIVCKIPGEIAKGQDVLLNFSSQITVENQSTITLSAIVAPGGKIADPVSSNNEAKVDLNVVAGTDVSIAKTRTRPGLIYTDDIVTFTLYPNYVGTKPKQAVVTDNLPDNYQFISVAADSGWICPASGQTVRCEYTEGNGTDYKAPIVIVAKAIKPTGAQGVTNTATIESENENPDLGGNNSGTDVVAHIADPKVDLVAHKSRPDRNLVTVGNEYEFRLNTSNKGNIGFTGPLTITDHLPAGLTVNKIAAPVGWTCPAVPIAGKAEIICTTDQYTENNPLRPDAQTPAIVLTAEVTGAGTFANGMTVSFPDDQTRDADLTNNSTSTGDMTSADGQNWADVSIIKSVLNSPVKAGDEITFRLELINAGPKDALDVHVSDRLNDIVADAGGGLPKDIKIKTSMPGLVCSSAASGAYSRDLSCNIETLPVCTPTSDCPIIEVTVRPGKQGAKTNIANAYSLKTPDNKLENNQSSILYNVVPRTDVTVKKSSPSENAGAKAGQELLYVLTAKVENTGLSDAENVTVTDTLPDGLIFVGATASAGGACSVMPNTTNVTGAGNNQIICNLGTINNGSQQTVTVRVIPTTSLVGKTPVNNVTVATDTDETDDQNNSADLPIRIDPSDLDLLITKSDGPDPVEIRTDTIYSVTVKNSGPSDAFNLMITDIFPSDGLANPRLVQKIAGGTESFDDISETVPGGKMTYQLPYLKAGASAEFTVAMKAVKRGKYNNTVTVVSDETKAGFDRIPQNNTAHQDTTVRVRSDIFVKKVPSADTVDLREEFSWDITVTNNTGQGLDVAENVTLQDTLPNGMELTQAPIIIPAGAGRSCQGAKGGREITCELGDLALGDVVAVRLFTKITDIKAEAASNTAIVKTDSFEDKTGNNTSTGTVKTVKGSSISGKIYRDFNANDTKEPTDTGISGVSVTVTGQASHDKETITLTLRTNAQGEYDFTQLPPGTYSVFYGGISEPNLTDGKALPAPNDVGAPSSPVASGVNRIDGIIITSSFESKKQDFTRVPLPRIELTKAAGTITYLDNGSYVIPYTLTVKNPSLEPLIDITVTDILTEAGQNYGRYNASGTPDEGEYSVKSISTGFGTLQSGFTGSGNNILVSDGKLPANNLSGNAPNTSATVSFTIVVNPEIPRVVPVVAHLNKASVTGEGEYSGKPVETSASASITPVITPKIELKKSHTYAPVDGVAKVGDRIDYSFKVTNTGNTPLLNIKLTDELDGLVGLDATTVIHRLNPKQSDSSTFKAHYLLTQADLDNGKVPNTALATGEWSTNGDADKVSATDDELVENLSKPGLTLLKELERSEAQDPTNIGDTIRYKFTVTNTGNTILNDVKITDQLAGIAPDPVSAFTIGTLNPAEVKVVYANYSVVLKDIDAAEVHNIAIAGGTAGPNKTPVTTDPSEVKVPLSRNPKLELTKVLNGTAPESPRVGDMLTWTVTAKNSGNVTLSNLVLGDDFADAVITPAIVPSLAPDATVDFTVTAPLKQSDIDAGEARNIAKIDFNDPEKPQPPVDSNEVITPLPQKPAIALKKTGDVAGLSSPPKVGEKIAYTMVIRNTGNVALKNVTLTDELEGFILDVTDEARLKAVVLPAKTPTNSLSDTEITVHGTYALKPADIDAGKVTNIAETTGTSVIKPDEVVKDTSGTEFENDDPSITDLTREPQIRLIKTIADTALSTPPQVGDIITFGFEIRNTGNVTIDNIRIEDQVAGVDVQNVSGWTGPLEAGAENIDAFTATYALTQDDIDKGSFANTAVVIGSSVGGKTPDDVTDISGTDIDNDTPTEQTFNKVTGLSIVKSETHALSTPPVPGDLITYSFVVTNTGNVTLTDVVVTDPLSDLVMPETTIAKLLPGAANAVTLTATYAIKQSDIQTGEVENKASATGIYTDPSTKVPETVPPVDSNEIIVPLDQVPAIAVVKSAVSALTEPAEEGQEITYTFTVTNTGNMELTDVKVEDPLPGINPSSFNAGDLVPNESKTFTAIYAITLEDIDNEQVVNQATATGTYDDGSGPKITTDLSGPDIHTDEPLIVPVVPPVPELTIVKTGTWNDENANGYPEVGEKVEFTFNITNSGNAILFNVTPADIGPSFNNKTATGKLSAFTPDPVTLNPNDNQKFTATYVLTQEDIDAAAGIVSAVNNIATAKGNVRNGKEYESPESVAKVTLPATEPNAVTITKQAMLRQVKRGERVPYIIRVENNSTSNAGPVNVIDMMPAGFRYVEDSAMLDGNPVPAIVNGRQIRFENLPLGPKSTLEIRVDLLVLSTAGPGKHTNVASVTDRTGTPVAKDAKAVVEIVAEPVFDCGDIVGKVFDDKNRNGYQDEGEPGLAGVRIATAKGWLVTTDEHGRFHVACAALPDQRIGSNFIMKLDPRTLPSGYRITTENPRVVRLTAGKMTKLNFGATIGRVVRLDVTADAFEASSTELKRRWADNIGSLITVLRKEPSVLRLSYIDANTKPELAKQRIKHLRDLVAERWRKDGERYQLDIETRSEAGK